MESITKKLKDNIVSGCISDTVYGREGIKQIIYEQSGMVFGVDYIESHFAGSLASLVKKGQLISVGRGKYQMLSASHSGVGAVQEEELDEKVEIKQINCEERTQEISKIINYAEKSVKEECDYLKELMNGVKFSWNDLNKKDIRNMLLIKEMIEYLEKCNFS